MLSVQLSGLRKREGTPPKLLQDDVYGWWRIEGVRYARGRATVGVGLKIVPCCKCHCCIPRYRCAIGVCWAVIPPLQPRHRKGSWSISIVICLGFCFHLPRARNENVSGLFNAPWLPANANLRTASMLLAGRPSTTPCPTSGLAIAVLCISSWIIVVKGVSPMSKRFMFWACNPCGLQFGTFAKNINGTGGWSAFISDTSDQTADEPVCCCCS